jgi:hypothetical protein
VSGATPVLRFAYNEIGKSCDDCRWQRLCAPVLRFAWVLKPVLLAVALQVVADRAKSDVIRHGLIDLVMAALKLNHSMAACDALFVWHGHRPKAFGTSHLTNRQLITQ